MLTKTLRLSLFALLSGPVAVVQGFGQGRVAKPPMTQRTAARLWSQGPKWSTAVNEFRERAESAKAAVVGGVVGSVSFAPFDFLNHLGAVEQWEFNTDAAALESALFAVVYRYATREDENPQLKQGAVGAFVLVRTLALVQVPGYCQALPLDCGAPFGYLNFNMIFQLAQGFVESSAAFGATALALEYLARRGLVGRFPSSAPNE